ncbi:MAG: FkbM family methyltransferase [Symploca sp. SIO2D2]|nr:FkbM family methyltransferase [Symploca sp. SIO2D2]NER22229.1 FkbM family methyltransferase [Symploca sp. SIO1C2]
MQVEPCCQALLSQILPEVDKKCLGLTIEVGVGTFAFYFKLFEQLGFQAIAVEPLPTEQVRQLCSSGNISLIESCISDIDGLVDFYLGSYEGQRSLNLNSMRPDWWGSSSTAIQVPSMSLHSLLSTLETKQLTCLKIDVEGMEFSIIKQLPSLPENLLPQVLMFEYGGGSTRKRGQGGWSQEILDETMKSLDIICNLGYRQAIIVDSAANGKEQVIDLKAISLEPTVVFPPQSVYGNIITLRGAQYTEEKIAAVCQLYRA